MLRYVVSVELNHWDQPNKIILRARELILSGGQLHVVSRAQRAAEFKGLKMSIENWFPIPGYKKYYEISTFGRIMSLKGGTKLKKFGYLKPQLDKDGYYIVRLYKNTLGRTFKIHRLVALVFIKKSKLQVNHKDTNKQNNHLDNLEYLSNQQNRDHACKNGLHAKGEKAGGAKLYIEDIQRIRFNYSNGFEITHAQLAKEYGVSRSQIGRIIRGERWQHVST